MDAEALSLNTVVHPQNGSWSSQRQSAFFKLPREIRDSIYENAFGDGALSFNYRGLNISASTGILQRTSPTPGLPRWLLTCHMICSEGIEAFLRTRDFSPRYRQLDRASPPNSGLLSKNSVRNIKLECPYATYWRDADSIMLPTYEAPFRMFLQFIQSFLTENPKLTVEWAKYGSDWSVARELAVYENWPKRLLGRFCRVRIDVLTRRGENQDQHLKRMQSAERFAKKLVGDNGGKIGVLWGEEMKLGVVSPKPCARCKELHGESWDRVVRRLIVWQNA